MADGTISDLLVAAASLRRQSRASLPPPVRPRLRVPPPEPDRQLELRLADGRRVRARIAPAVARRKDLAAVAHAADENDRRAFGALRHHRTSIAALNERQDALEQRVATLDHRGDLRPTPPFNRDQVRQTRELQQLALRSQIQNVTNVINGVQAAAYGDKGSLLSTNNLLLAGNQLFWTLLDPVLRTSGIVDGTMATVLAAVAPLGTLFTGEILLGDRQHVRFVTGVTTFTQPGIVREGVPIASRLWPSFRQRTDVPVTVSALDAVTTKRMILTGRVTEGVLEIELRIPGQESPFPTVRVAWTVDTGADGG